jgi:hypothetical protein
LRRAVVSGLIAFAPLQPAVSLLGQPLDGRRSFQVIGAVVLAVLVCGPQRARARRCSPARAWPAWPSGSAAWAAG